jgi:valyl-tRNA synthetase
MKNESLMICPWPGKDAAKIDKEILETMPLLQDIVRAVRNIRRNLNIPNKQEIKLQIFAHDDVAKKKLDDHHEFLKKMANLNYLEIDVQTEYSKKISPLSEVVGDFQIFAFVEEEMFDKDTERKKQQEHLNKVESHLGVVQKKLHNENFVKNAPEKIVNAERDREAELLGQITKIKEALQGLEKSVPN